MKKTLSVLSLIAILGLSTPAFAAPPGGPGGPGGPQGHGPHGGGGHRIHAGVHHRAPHMAPRHHHGGVMIHTGYHPRHSYWRSYGSGYWGYPWCDYRLGCYSYPGVGVHIPMGGASFSLHF